MKFFLKSNKMQNNTTTYNYAEWKRVRGETVKTSCMGVVTGQKVMTIPSIRLKFMKEKKLQITRFRP